MALLSGTRGFVLGFTTGFGAGLFARDLLPHVKRLAAPALKFSLRASVGATERAREIAARFGEVMQDTLAEVHAELRQRGEEVSGRKKKRKTARSSEAPQREKNRRAPKAPSAPAPNVIELAERRPLS